MKILMILSRVPYPLEKGDKLRAFHQIKALSKNHKIILCCLNDTKLHHQALSELSKYCEELNIIQLNPFKTAINLILNLFSSTPWQVRYFYQKKAQKIIDKTIETHMPRHVFCQLIRTTEYVKKYTVLPKSIDYMDALSTGIERRIKKSPWPYSALLKQEAKRLRAYEQEIFDAFDNHFIISEQDKRLMQLNKAKELIVLPNGVDTDFFKPQPTEKKYDLVFTGNMSYPPNIDCANFIAREIMPLVWEVHPHARLLISGANPTRKVKQLSNDKVKVTGWVDDIRESYAHSKIFVAPLRIGTGLQNKLLEAMAMKLPCITSSLCNNALKAKDNESILISDSAVHTADIIIELLNNPKKMEQIGENGYRFILKSYSWENCSLKLNNIIESTPM